MTRLAKVLAFSAAISFAPSASAFEHQQHAGIGPELGMLKVDGKSGLSVGLGLRAHYTYGLNDTFNLLVEGASAIVALEEKIETPTTPHNRPTQVGGLGVGVAYVIDILQFVPYVGVLGEGTLLTGGTLDKAQLKAGAAVAVGFDWQLQRNFALGIAARQHFMLTDLSNYPTYTTIGLRAEYVWGW